MQNKPLVLYPFLILVLIGFYVIHYFTPMQSDDFSYAQMGWDFEKHKWHYLNWSGRLVSDYISGGLLQITSKPLLALIQTIGMFGLIFFLSQMAFIARNEEKSLFIFLLVTMLYVLANPRFGQTTLWVVGSANYMWTNLIAAAFLASMFRFLYTQKSPMLALILGVFAGCSNENLCIALIGITLCVIAYRAYLDKKLNITSLTALVLLVIGAIILIKAPGNELRLLHPAFEQWRNLSFYEKAKLHFTQRLPLTSNGWLAILLLFWLLGIMSKNKESRIFLRNKLPTSLTISWFLVLVAIMTNVIMVASPLFGGRSMSSGFCITLASLSFALHHAYTYRVGNKLIHRYGTFTFLVFVFAYISLFSGYSSYHEQEKLRLHIINSLKQQNVTNAQLPGYSTRSMIPNDFRIDSYIEKATVAHYYELDSVKFINFPFDITGIDKKNKVSNLVKNSSIQSVYNYSQALGFETIFIVKLSDETNTKLQSKNTSLFVQVTNRLGKTYNFPNPYLPKKINSSYYVAIKVNMPSLMIKEARITLFDKTTNEKNSTAFFKPR